MDSLRKAAHLVISLFPCTKIPTWKTNFIRQIVNKYVFHEHTHSVKGLIPYLSNIYSCFSSLLEGQSKAQGSICSFKGQPSWWT